MDSRKQRIAILSHKLDTFESRSYVLRHLTKLWTEQGHDVFFLYGVADYRPADILFMHVNLTVVPDEYLAFAKKYPVVVNASVADISKSKLSTHLVQPGCADTGPVIVKTDNNCGGTPEKLVRRRGSRGYRMLRKVRRLFSFGKDSRKSCDYQIYQTQADVPAAVWNDQKLVVEKFLPEREGEYFCIRQWLFIGDREYSQRVYSPKPIVKANDVVKRDYDCPVPEALRERRRQLGFDFGKFDYTVVDGEVVLFDTNSTPMMRMDGSPSLRLQSALEELSRGLYSFTAEGKVES